MRGSPKRPRKKPQRANLPAPRSMVRACSDVRMCLRGDPVQVIKVVRGEVLGQVELARTRLPPSKLHRVFPLAPVAGRVNQTGNVSGDELLPLLRLGTVLVRQSALWAVALVHRRRKQPFPRPPITPTFPSISNTVHCRILQQFGRPLPWQSKRPTVCRNFRLSHCFSVLLGPGVKQNPERGISVVCRVMSVVVRSGGAVRALCRC